MLQINRVFSDHMVLQREKEIRIWGTCSENVPITAQLAGVTVKAKQNGDIWTAVFPPMQGKKGQTLTIRCKNDVIEINDVNIGEVWIAAGQSNMEFYMKYDAEVLQEKQKCRQYDIRFYDIPETCYPGQENDFDYSRMGFWRKCNAEDLDYFSAVAYYFAKEINEDLDVPIGIIGCNRGASAASAWMSREILEKNGQVWLNEYADMEDTGKQLEEFKKSREADTGNPFGSPDQEELLYGISREKQMDIMASMPEEMKVVRPAFNNRPGCLYQFMLKQIVPYTIRGILWYQGENDVQHADLYKEIFRDLISFWRSLWKETIPFVCVQLAPFEEWLMCRGDQFPIIRQAQKEVADEEEGVYLISSSDAGMRYDIHPKMKRPIGERLALCARKYIYNEPVHADAPEPDKIWTDGRTLMLHFKHDGEYLEIHGKCLNALKIFEYAGTKLKETGFTKEDIHIKNNILMVPLDTWDGKKKLRVEYAQCGYYEVNLYSNYGIPALPFVIETKAE